MERRANEFLELSGRLYEENKRKWKTLFKDFDEDVYNDTILKVYDNLLDGVDTEGDLNGYWFKSFKNNLKRHKDYKENQSKGEIDNNVKEKGYEENDVSIYYSTIKDIFNRVRNNFDRKTFEVFRLYMLCKMSYDELDNLTGLDSKERIMKVRRWLNGGKENFR